MSRLSYAGLWKSQFKAKNFLLRDSFRDSFAKSQWGELVLPMALFRTALFIYTLVIQIYAPLEFKLGAKFLIFATYWAYLTLVLALFLSTVNTWVYFCKNRQGRADGSGPHDIGWAVKLQWLVTNICTSMAVVATVIFWALFYTPGTLNFANFNTHAVNLIIVVLEFSISRAPVRLLHFYQPTLFMLTYAVFTVVYWKAGGTNDDGDPYIYKTIDFNTNLGPALALVFATALVAVPIVHLVWFLLYTIRVTIWQGTRSRDTIEPTLEGNPEGVPMSMK